MIQTYFPFLLHFIVVTVLLTLLLLKQYVPTFVILLVYFIARFIWRKSSNCFFEESDDSKMGIVSPVNGRVMRINGRISDEDFGENVWMITVRLSWWMEKGIYLPKQSEIEVGNFKEKKQLLFKSRDGELIGIKFSKSRVLPRLRVRSKDRGKTGANIGFMPIGGTVFLYLSGNYEILLEEGYEIIAGKTVLAMR